MNYFNTTTKEGTNANFKINNLITHLIGGSSIPFQNLFIQKFVINHHNSTTTKIVQ